MADNENEVRNCDQPPDLSGARTAAWEARRFLAISRWPLVLTVGLGFAVFAGTQLLTERNEVAGDLLSGITLLLMGIAAAAWPVIARKMRSRLGSFALSRAAKSKRVSWVTIGLVCSLGVAAAVTFSPAEDSLGFGMSPMSFLCIAFGIYTIYWTINIRLWEYVFLGVSLIALPGILKLHPGQPAFLFLLFIVMTGIGLSLYVRWHKWIGSLPREDEGDESLEDGGS